VIGAKHKSQKTGSGVSKTARTSDACMLMQSFATRSTFSAVRAGFGLPLLILSFVADPMTVHAHEYVCILILLNLTSTFQQNLAIIGQNVTSHNK